MGTRIETTDLARDALYTKVNQIADEKQDVLTAGTCIDITDNIISVNASTDTDLGTSDTVVPSQKAVKTYVDNGLSTKANDSSVVHKAGNETISDDKTFTSNIIRANMDITKGTNPSTSYYDAIEFTDKNGKGNTNRIGLLESKVDSNGLVSTYITSYKYTSGTTTNARIAIIYPLSGDAYTEAPTPATSDNSTKIATTAFVKNQGYATSSSLSSNYVNLTSNQSVDGNKTFTSGFVGIKNTGATRGTIPSRNNNDFVIQFRDSTDDYVGRVYQCLTTGGDSFMVLQSYKNEASSHSHVCALYLRYYANDTKSIYPQTTYTTLGTSSNRWSTIYADSSTISTSDERVKQNIESIPDEVLDAWGEVNFYQFKFKDSVSEKGENARIHTGVIAQRIKSVFENHNLDATNYGLLCYDEWDAQPAQRDENGYIVEEAREAGDLYSIRYEECLCMEAAYQRRRADRIEERLRRLEEKL